MQGDDVPIRISGITPDHQEALREALKTKLCSHGMPIVRFVDNGNDKRLGGPDGICVWVDEVPEGVNPDNFEQLVKDAFKAANCPMPQYIGSGI